MLAGASLYKRVKFWKELLETQIAQIKKSHGSGRLYALSNEEFEYRISNKE